MTTAEERFHLVLSRGLRFGDREQIEAVKFFGEMDALKAVGAAAKWVLCPACDGASFILCDCDDEDCVRCNEKWMDACAICEERGVVDCDFEPITALDAVSEAAHIAFVYWMMKQRDLQDTTH